MRYEDMKVLIQCVCLHVLEYIYMHINDDKIGYWVFHMDGCYLNLKSSFLLMH